MPEPLRYSEDLDYVAFGITGADFGPVLSALREVAGDTGWWSGETDVLTFHPAEMIGTKFRALTQRSNGRDLNDLELAHAHLGLEDGQLAACAAHYRHHERISSNEFKSRLFAHLGDTTFAR